MYWVRLIIKTTQQINNGFLCWNQYLYIVNLIQTFFSLKTAWFGKKGLLFRLKLKINQLESS